jgi:hypothetical protein
MDLKNKRERFKDHVTFRYFIENAKYLLVIATLPIIIGGNKNC